MQESAGVNKTLIYLGMPYDQQIILVQESYTLECIGGSKVMSGSIGVNQRSILRNALCPSN